MPGKRVVPLMQARGDRGRAAKLRAHGLLEPLSDSVAGPLLRAAARAAGATSAVIAIDAGRRTYCVASSGVEDADARAELARFACDAVRECGGGIIADAAADGRWRAHDAVTGGPHVRFAAVLPLIFDDGLTVGAIGIFDCDAPHAETPVPELLEEIRDAVVAVLRERPVQSAAFFDVLDASGDNVLITEGDVSNPQRRHITYCNDRFAISAGYTAEELRSHGIRLLVGPRTDVEVMEKAVQDLLDGRSVRFECELYRKDGTTFWSEWYSRPSFLADGSFRWLSIERDITALKERIVEMSALRRALDESADFVLTAEGTPASGGSPMVSYANEPFLTAFGYARAELVGQPLTILAGPATDKALLHDLQERLEQGDSATRELLLYRSDGSALWVELSTQPVEGDNGRVARWVVVARDVSRRRRTQEQLLVLSTAIQHANDAIVIYAIDSSGRRKPRVVYINDAVLKNSGFTREEVFNQSTGVGPKTDKGALRSLRDRLNRGESVRTRLELYRKDGSSYWAEIDARPIMDERGRVTHWISIERDISDVVARERQLERERRIFANLHVAVAELVGALDRRSLADAFSRGVESVGECTTDRLQPAGAAPAHDQPIVRSDDARKVLLNAPDAEGGAMQLILRRRDAEGFDDVALVALQLYLQAYHSALHNVGLYEELAARRSTVIELNQSKSDLIAMLAHDFKGPLASIIGFSQLLQQEFAPSDEAHDMLAQIERGAYRLVDLANDTLAFSRAEQNELAIDVTDNDYVELLSEIAALHKDQRAIQVIAAGGPVIGRFDWQRMRQVFDNLISNAIKYSPTGEPVHIGVSRVGNAAVIAVRDHGIGIPANELQSIFERFGRGTNAKAARIKGTGFGLYLARSIVEQHGGRIGVESRVGYGSAFTVTVPLQLPLELAASQRALVVDPEGDVRSFVAYTLRSNGYAVRVAETAAAALEFLDAGAFGLCVLDSDAAPDESGTLQTLVQRARQAGAAVVTLHGKQRREAPGGDVALEKPYLTGELFAAITNATQRLKEHSLARQHPSG